jgi:MFS family permease
LGDVLHLSATRTGILASADLTGIALTTATAPWWLRRVSWRRTVLASLLTFLLINLLCLAVRSFWPLLCLRVLARLSAGAAGVYAIDAVRLSGRLDAFYAFLCGGLLIAPFVSARWYPDDPGDRPPAGQIAWRVLAGRGTLVVAGTGLHFLMISAVWGYLEGIARAAGLSLEQTGTALSGGLVSLLAQAPRLGWDCGSGAYGR